MIEKALVSALKAAVSNATVYPSMIPEGEKTPFICFREVDRDSSQGFSNYTNTVQFEIDAAYSSGLEPDDYELSKVMAKDIRLALSSGFEFGGVCVYDTNIEKQQDMVDDVAGMFWTRSTYTFTYNEPL